MTDARKIPARLSVDLPPHLMAALEDEAAERGTSKAEVVKGYVHWIWVNRGKLPPKN